MLHILLEHDCLAFKTIELKLALRGIARLNPHCPRRAFPMTPELLSKMYQVLDKNDPIDMTMYALYLIAFFSLLRKSNLVSDSSYKFDPNKQLSRNNVIVGDSCMLLIITWSKTIQYGDRKLKIPLLAVRDNVLCPVSAYRRMCKLVPAKGNSPAFCIRQKSGWGPITYRHLTQHLSKTITKTGNNSTLYSSHSFRRGGATWAFKCNIPAEFVMLQGDWKSNAYMKYIDYSLEQKMFVAQKMMNNLQS